MIFSPSSLNIHQVQGQQPFCYNHAGNYLLTLKALYLLTVVLKWHDFLPPSR